MVAKNQGHPGHRRRRLTADLRREIVLSLRLRGMSDRQIANHIKVEYGLTRLSPTTVNTDWKAALASRRDENDEDFVDLLDTMNARYERQLATWWIKSLAGDHRAAEIVLRILKALREMNGLDADLGSFIVPQIIEQEDGDIYDYSQLTPEDQQHLATLAEKAKVVHIDDARQRFA